MLSNVASDFPPLHCCGYPTIKFHNCIYAIVYAKTNLKMPHHRYLNELDWWFYLEFFGFTAVMLMLANPRPFLREIIDFEAVNTVNTRLIAWRVWIHYFHMHMTRHLTFLILQKLKFISNRDCWNSKNLL